MNTDFDRYIIDRIKQGDKAAFEALFESYYDSLLTFARSYISNREEARDLVQDAFIALWERAAQQPPIENMYGYLLNSVKNRSLNLLRHKKVKEKHSQTSHDTNIKELELQCEALGQFPLEKLMSDDLQKQLNSALETLPEQSRKVFVMRCMQYMKPREIAEQLDISEKTVKNHLTKAIKLLQVQFSSPLSLLLLLHLSGKA